MNKNENTILTVLCMVYRDDEILLQNRIKADWQGLTFPGGHVEKGESFVNAAIREMKEETGLTVDNLQICGVKQFPTENDERYLVLLFKTNSFSGELCSSHEGEMVWVKRTDLPNLPTVPDFLDLLKVFDDPNLNEFVYEKQHNDWNIKIY